MHLLLSTVHLHRHWQILYNVINFIIFTLDIGANMTIMTKDLFFSGLLNIHQTPITHTEQKVTLTSHWKGFSPVCVLMCSSSPRFWLKALWHSLHLYGFSCSNKHIHILLSKSAPDILCSTSLVWPQNLVVKTQKPVNSSHTVWYLFLHPSHVLNVSLRRHKWRSVPLWQLGGNDAFTNMQVLSNSKVSVVRIPANAWAHEWVSTLHQSSEENISSASKRC